MYQGKYPDGALPPGYHGVAYSPPEPPQEPEPCPCHEHEHEPCNEPVRPAPPEKPDVCEPCEVCETSGRTGLLDKLFSHKLDLEDLLLLALIVMTISSGADHELITMLVLLFVLGL